MMIVGYLSRRILAAFSVVLVGFVLLEFVLSSINEVTYQTRNEYQAVEALWFLLYTTPARLYQFSPSILLLSILVGLGGLAASSELTVLRASGLSILRIISLAMMPLMVIFSMMFVLGEFWAPQLYQQASQQKSALRQERVTGGWHREGQWILHAQTIEQQVLRGVTLYQLSQDFQQVQSIYQAPTALAVAGGWELQQAVQEDYLQRPLAREQLSTWLLPIQANAELMRALLLDPKTLSLPQNYAFLRYLNEQQLASDALAFSFWQRLYQPILALCMMFAGASFVFGSNRSMATSSRIFIGLVAGILLQLLQDLLAPLTLVLQWPAAVMTAIPWLISLMVAAWLLRRAG